MESTGQASNFIGGFIERERSVSILCIGLFEVTSRVPSIVDIQIFPLVFKDILGIVMLVYNVMRIKLTRKIFSRFLIYMDYTFLSNVTMCAHWSK